MHTATRAFDLSLHPDRSPIGPLEASPLDLVSQAPDQSPAPAGFDLVPQVPDRYLPIEPLLQPAPIDLVPQALIAPLPQALDSRRPCSSRPRLLLISTPAAAGLQSIDCLPLPDPVPIGSSLVRFC